MERRINIGWSVKDFSVLLDLRTGEFIAYASVGDATRVHEAYGGRNYYRSRSGLSGAGWIPGHVALQSLATYRVDGAYVEAPRINNIPATMLGFVVIAPIDCRGRNIPRDWPIAAIKGFRRGDPSYDQLYLLDSGGFEQLLVGDESCFKDLEIRIRYISSACSEEAERVFPARISRGTQLNFKRAVIKLFNSELAFDAGEEGYLKANRFWRQLGLWQIGDSDRFFKIAQNVCSARYTREELSRRETLQAASPANVFVLAPNLYIQEIVCGQETGRRFKAVALFNVNDEEVGVERWLEPAEAVRAIEGNFAGIMVKLWQGLRSTLEQSRSRPASRRAIGKEQWAAEKVAV